MFGVASFPFLTAIERSRLAILIEGDTEVTGSELVPDAYFLDLL